MNIFFFKQKTAYEMRISDWSSDVCSSDLPDRYGRLAGQDAHLVPYGRTVGMESSDHSPRSRSYCAHVEAAPPRPARSEERRVGKRVSVRVDLGVCRIIKNKIIVNRFLHK